MEGETRIKVSTQSFDTTNPCSPSEPTGVEFVRFEQFDNVNLVIFGREVVFDKKELLKILEFLKR